MITKQQLITYLDKGMSARKIEACTGISWWKVNDLIHKYNIEDHNSYSKPNYNENFFNKIETKEQAYCLGFLLGDGCIDKRGHIVSSIALQDQIIMDFICKQLNCTYRTYYKYDKKTKTFPHCTIHIGNNKLCKDLKMLFGGRLKPERHIPIIKRSLEPYLVQGFFDAEGCVTWGYQKAKGRLWHKVSFTSQYKMLEGIQQILIKNDIPLALRPKSNDNCYVMETHTLKVILKLLDYIYSDKDFIVLPRKYEKQLALRLELDENGESLYRKGQYRAKPTA